MKFFAFFFVLLYLYSVSYGIFLTELIRIPAPLFFSLPLLLIFRSEQRKFLYGKELLVITIAMFLYYVIGLSDEKTFISNMITITICALYFNYFVGNDEQRFNLSVFVVYAFLGLSALVMVFNPFYFVSINALRSSLMGEPVIQSPSGIAVYQFNFGYQLAALLPFLFLFTSVFKKPFLIKGLSLVICLLFIYLGLQRSVFVSFLCSVLLFLWFYYGYKAVFIVILAAVTGMLLYSYVLRDNFDSYNNILSKNEHSSAEYDRITLTTENLRIYTEYPYGLIFYGKSWGDVIYRNQVFSSGITSHNAYLMFITYLGPLLGSSLLILLYYRILNIFIRVLQQIKKREYAMITCLCFSFLAVSINSLSHNAWLLSANGPTFFLYFAILQLDTQLKKKEKDTRRALDQHSEKGLPLNDRQISLSPEV